MDIELWFSVSSVVAGVIALLLGTALIISVSGAVTFLTPSLAFAGLVDTLIGASVLRHRRQRHRSKA